MSKSSASISEDSLSFGSRTHVGRVRDHNEDSLAVIPPLFVVADGMGGHEAGDIASEITVETLSEYAPRTIDADALVSAVERANYNVLRAPRQGIGSDGMGTTLTAAIVEGERLLIAQVGDSRAYLSHNGSLQQLTRDHSLMADLIEAGHIAPEEARYHPNRSVITRAIGSDPNMKPDIYELNVESGDRLLICSDGLTTMLEDHLIEAIINNNPDPQACADALVEAALQAGGSDNVTVIVVNIAGYGQIREKKKARKSKTFYVGIILALLAICVAAIFAGVSYVNNSAYLIEENGTVSVYRGLPDELFGMPLSTLDHTTTVEVDKLQPGVANRIKEGMTVANLDEANTLIQAYEEEIARTDEAAANSNPSDNQAQDQSSDSGGRI